MTTDTSPAPTSPEPDSREPDSPGPDSPNVTCARPVSFALAALGVLWLVVLGTGAPTAVATAASVGLVPAMFVARKGRSLLWWWAAGTFALVAAYVVSVELGVNIAAVFETLFCPIDTMVRDPNPVCRALR